MFTGEQPCQSAISIKLYSNFIEITLRRGCSPVNLLHIFRAPFPRNTSVWLIRCSFWLQYCQSFRSIRTGCLFKCETAKMKLAKNKKWIFNYLSFWKFLTFSFRPLLSNKLFVWTLFWLPKRPNSKMIHLSGLVSRLLERDFVNYRKPYC